MKELYIIGAGGFGREVLQWCKDINSLEYKWDIKGFLDDDLGALNGYKCDCEVVGRIKDWIPKDNEVFVIAVGEPLTKESIASSLLKKNAVFVSVIHPTAIIGQFNHIGQGVVIYPYAKITTNVYIGDFVSILGSNIGHDVYIGDYSTICGMVSVNGHATIGKRVFVGSHSVIAPEKKIGDDAYVGNGSVVISNVKTMKRVFGNPAHEFNL